MVELTWYGNATLAIRGGATTVLFDPVMPHHHTRTHLRPEDLTGVDGIAITHGHFDHAAGIPEVATQWEVPILLPHRVASTLVIPRTSCRATLRSIAPEETVALGELFLQPFPSRHIVFDRSLVAATAFDLLRRPTLRRLTAAYAIHQTHRRHPMGSCVAWYLRHRRTSLLHLGSCALDPRQTYPRVDLLGIPLQGHSRIHERALAVVERLQPRAVYLHHFDDAFPPISRAVPPERFVDLMERHLPDVPVFVPTYRAPFVYGESATPQ